MRESSMTVQWTLRGLAVIVVALVLALALKSCQRSDVGVKIPPRLERTLDSLDATAATFKAARDSAARIVASDALESARLTRVARIARVESDGFRRAADSIAVLASAQADSAALWREAYDARTTEATQLRVALDTTETALKAERAARANVARLWQNAEIRQRELEHVTDGLRSAITRLEKPCRIVGPIPCPSRTVSAVGGVMLGVVALSSTRR